MNRNDPRDRNQVRTDTRGAGDDLAPPQHEGDYGARAPLLHRWTHAPEIWRDEDDRSMSNERGVPGGYGQGGAGPLGAVGMRGGYEVPRREPPREAIGLGAAARARAGARRGGMAGLAPMHYQRPDQRIYEDVCDALTAHDEVDPTHVEVRVEGGEVTLTGTVEDRAMKRLIEEVVEGVLGVRDVHVHLKVPRASTPAPHGAKRPHEA